MSEFGEAAGAASGGGMPERAAEPAAAGAASDGAGHTRESACLNCGTPLLGAHCHACGQRAHVHRTIGAFAHDLMHGVLHFEGKTWRTLSMLALKPGQLTREYIDGRRASYVSPIAMFLFVVFLSFAAFSLLGGSAIKVDGSAMEAARSAYADNAAKIAGLRRERATLGPDAGDRAVRIDTAIKELENDQRSLRMIVGEDGAETGSGPEAVAGTSGAGADSTLGKAIAHVRANPQLAIYKAQTSAYKYSWALIPLSVPFVWLLFAFSRRFTAYDHTVFSTYSITFMIALVAVASLFFYAGLGAIGGLLLLYAPVHMFRQLRGTYALGRPAAAWRTVALSLFAWVAIALFASMIGVLVA